MTAMLAKLRIARAADNADNAVRQLLAVMREHCPGPHDYRQHRDNRKPWCDTCRYQIDGRPVPRPADDSRIIR